MRKKMIYFFISIIGLIVVTVISLITVIRLNHAHLMEAPGLYNRLIAFLSTNVAETSENHVYPELKTRYFGESDESLFDHSIHSVQKLGWEIVSSDSAKKEMQIEIKTPLWKFVDDMQIRVEAIDESRSSLYIRSSSRVGKGDLGANSGHIYQLYHRLAKDGVNAL